MEKTHLNLSSFPLSLKVAATCFLVSALVGYGFALIKIYDLSHFSLHQALLYYRGDETGMDPLALPQAFRTMLSIAHVHTMSQPLLFAILSFLFSFSNSRERKKIFFILLFFFGMMASNASPWLVRYASAHAILLFPISQVAIFISMMKMTVCSLSSLWRR